MRRLAYVLLVLLILPALVTGQVTVTTTSSMDFTATNNWTGPQQFANGTAAVPSIAWTSDADGTGTGLYRRAANEVSFTSNGIGVARIGAASDIGGLAVIGNPGGTGWLGFAPTIGSATDAFFTREAAATIQLDVDVNGAAIDQTIKGPDGITGTDKTGGSLTLGPGRGTGAAVGGSTILNRNLVGATGTTAQTQAPAYIACPTKILSNTSATAQTMATITTTSTTGGSVKMFFTVVANNGTLQDTDAGEIVIGWNNNAGTVAVAASAVYGQMDSDASGTLATTPTVTAATNVVSIKFTPTWVTIVPTTVTGFATFEVNGVNTVACQ